jgi:hypothetical protein
MRTVALLSVVIEDRRGLLVFDTGLNPALAAQSRLHIGRLSDQWDSFWPRTGTNLSVQARTSSLRAEQVVRFVL